MLKNIYRSTIWPARPLHVMDTHDGTTQSGNIVGAMFHKSEDTRHTEFHRENHDRDITHLMLKVRFLLL